MKLRRTEGRFRLCLVLLILNLVFIWGNSLLPASASRAFSQWIQKLLSGAAGLDDASAIGHGMLRKLAHFLEFCTLGTLLGWLFFMQHKIWLLPLFYGFLAACTDELIQCMVPDRGPGITDVLIDTCGVAVGIGLLCLACYIKEKQNNQVYLEEKTQ